MALSLGPETWLAIGLAGQALFGARFLVQWIASERAGRSVIPNAFWYLSVAGSVFLVSYAVQRGDPVFIFGETVTALIFVRNLVLIRRAQAAERERAR
jgi:lipid-A-disaccharide synthase-like uncharacterized protein